MRFNVYNDDMPKEGKARRKKIEKEKLKLNFKIVVNLAFSSSAISATSSI